MSAPSAPFVGQDLRQLGDGMLSRVSATPAINITSATTTEIYAVDQHKIFLVYRLFAVNWDAVAVSLNFKSDTTSILNPIVLAGTGNAGDRVDFYGQGLPILMGLAEGDDFDVTSSGAGPTYNVTVMASIGIKVQGLI